MASTADIKNGVVLNIDGQLWSVVEFQHVKPGKGGAFVRTKLKNVMTGKVVDKTFNAGVKVDTANVDRRDMQYLYNDGEMWNFMDPVSFEQIAADKTAMGDAAKWLKDDSNEKCTIMLFNGVPLTVNAPNFVVLKIVETDPGVRGDTSGGGGKPAKLETGAVVRVPLFVQQEESVRVDTRTGDYLERA